MPTSRIRSRLPRDRGRVRGDGPVGPPHGQALGAPVGCVLEGGYALEALARSVAATLEALGEEPSEDLDGVPTAAAALEARARLEPWWPSLAGG